MSSLSKVVRSGVGRRRVQTVVIGLATFMAVAAAVLAGSLLVASTAPFDRGFTDQHGAHLSALFDGTTVTESQAAATAAASGVAESSGPFQVVTQTPNLGEGGGGDGAFELQPLTIAGRAQPTSGIDKVSLSDGHWPTSDTEIVLTEQIPLDSKLIFKALPGRPTLTVVGHARSVSRTADAWVLPGAIASLTSAGTKPGYQMLYRFTASATVSDMDTAKAAVVAAAPSGSMLGSQSWLTVKEAADRTAALFVPFLIAFGLLGLVMAMLSVGGVVAGAVSAATFRIGVLKAIGFTPSQVVRAYLLQALIPATVGIVLGVVGGNLLTIPVLAQTDVVYETAPSVVQPWVDALVVVAALGVVSLTALVAAARAGRLRTVDALAVGRAPAAGRGRFAASLSARLPLPRPVTLGLAQPFARPARMTAMLATVVFGAASVALAIGLTSSLNLIETARSHDKAQIMVSPMKMGPPEGGEAMGPPVNQQGPPPGPFDEGGPDPAAVTSAIATVTGTKASYGVLSAPATVAGVAAEVDVLAYRGDPRWAGFEMTEGRWYATAGEAILPTPMLKATGAKIGDTITLTVNGHNISVRVVGEVFSTQNEGMEVFTDLTTLTAVIPKVTPTEYYVGLTDGTDATAYANALETALTPFSLHANVNPGGHSDTLVAISTLTGLLTLILVAVAALGVLNAVVLQTRERVRELGVHKAIGMTPKQSVTVVLASVFLIGLVGGIAGVPAGMALHGVMVPAMGNSAGVRLPAALLDVYHPWVMALLALGGLVIAILGALMPAGWAARIRTATALRTE
ncbi:MAG: FtsX-like permease family protein [Hamadaea sp.]|uniref:ABC transporter permease n=1 Tax=Hamadaea sp. TaxID=2024425 RepID=UPI00181C635D|nr:FtsX-like permease family protein [Hamadaea sp.]NUR71930.1 FtsX-like permease family protein [Hamadaea sp.]NUT18233.1 FtsX-like permease family protein [Hamadaea sp.]